MTSVATFCPPRYQQVPEHVGTYGPEVADLADTAGMTLDPEQRLVIDAMYAYDARGRLVAPEIGCAAPRQNLKSHVLKAAALADLVLFGMPTCLWTAHLRQTADDAFSNGEGTGLAQTFEAYDHLRRLVDQVTDSDGEKSIQLRRQGRSATQAQVTFMARSERGGRGLSGKRVTFDEALFVKPPMLSAMVPILSAKSMAGDVQVRYMGSAGLQHSASWRAVRDRGRKGAPRLAWLEWMAPETPCDAEECSHELGSPGCALDREDLVRAANLAIGRRMDIDFVLQTERAAMTAQDYMRERLGWWDDPADEGAAFDTAMWAALADPAEPLAGTPTYGIATEPDASWSAVAMAWRRPDGKAQVHIARGPDERLDYRPTRTWVRARVEHLQQRFGGQVFADVASRGLVPDAEEPSGAWQAQADNDLHDAVLAQSVRHGNEAAANTAVRAAQWRSLGDTRVLDRKGTTGIAPVRAMALALRGLNTRTSTSELWGFMA